MPDAAIEAVGLRYRYGKQTAVDDLSFTVPTGSVCGFLGRNGAGKTTTIHMLLGLLRPAAGHARVLGFDPVREAVDVRRRVGFVAEHQQMYGWMRVKEIVRFTGGFYEDWDQPYAESLLSRYELDPKKRVRALSKGQQARLAILLAAAFHPELFILDDPTLGLDPIARQEILGDLIRLIQEEGRTVFISSHLLDELSQVADHVVIVDKGRLIANEPISELRDRVKEVVLTFPNGRPERLEIPGLLKVRQYDRQYALTTDQFTLDIQSEVLTLFKTVSYEVNDLSIDRIFADLVLRDRD